MPWCAACRPRCASGPRDRAPDSARRPRRGRRAPRNRWHPPARGHCVSAATVKPHRIDLANESSTDRCSALFVLDERNVSFGCTISTRGPTRWNQTSRPAPCCPRSSPISFDPSPAASPVVYRNSVSMRGISRKRLPPRSSQYSGKKPSSFCMPAVRCSIVGGGRQAAGAPRRVRRPRLLRVRGKHEKCGDNNGNLEARLITETPQGSILHLTSSRVLARHSDPRELGFEGAILTHSCRADIGSILVARRAGIQHASARRSRHQRAQPSRRPPDARIPAPPAPRAATGCRAAHRPIPSAIPIATAAKPCRKISANTLPGVAPSAMRTPISCVRRDVVYEITPYTPAAASSSARQPVIASSVIMKRRSATESADQFAHRHAEEHRLIGIDGGDRAADRLSISPAGRSVRTTRNAAACMAPAAK